MSQLPALVVARVSEIVDESAEHPVALPRAEPEVSIETIPTDAAEALRWLGTWRHSSAIDSYTGPLPGILAEIDRLIGRRATLEFLKEFGGTRVHFPRPGGWQPGNRIIKAVGKEAAMVLAEHFGGRELTTVPLGPLSIEWMRSVAIRALLVHGQHSVAEIARRCAGSERSVYKHKALLVDMDVLERRQETRSRLPPRFGLVSLLLADGTLPDDIARQLDVPLAEVDRQADLIRQRATAGRAGR